MIKAAITATALSLAACNGADPAATAERRYQIVREASGSHADLCEAAADATEAHLAAEDARQYRLWRAVEGTHCHLAALK